MNNHTSTPWCTAQGYQVIRVHESFRDELIADCRLDDCEFDKDFSVCNDNAAFIVKCVNNHDRLVEALKIAIQALKENNIDESMAGEFEILTDALQQCEERG